MIADYIDKDQVVAAVYGGLTASWRMYTSDGDMFYDHMLQNYTSPLLTNDWVVNSPIIFLPNQGIIAQFGAALNGWQAGNDGTGDYERFSLFELCSFKFNLYH